MKLRSKNTLLLIFIIAQIVFNVFLLVSLEAHRDHNSYLDTEIKKLEADNLISEYSTLYLITSTLILLQPEEDIALTESREKLKELIERAEQVRKSLGDDEAPAHHTLTNR